MVSQPRTERTWHLTMKWTLIALFCIILKHSWLVTEENTKITSRELNLSGTSWQNTKLNGRRELVSTKEIVSYRGAKSFVSVFLGERLSPSFIAIPYFPIVLLSWFLTSYCILLNISQNTVSRHERFCDKYQ